MTCNEFFFNMMSTSTVYLESYAYSGKFVNGLGAYAECNGDLNKQANNTGVAITPEGFRKEPLKNKYGLISFTNQSSLDRFAVHYVLGVCVYQGCDFTDSEPFAKVIADFVKSTTGLIAQDVEFYFPKQVLQQYQEDVSDQYWIMFSIMIFVILASLIGFVVESTSLGDLKLDDQTRNALSIDFDALEMHPILIRKLNDNILIAKKKLWANLFLSFSFNRNISQLFYPVSPNKKSKNIGYFLLAMGMIWNFFFISLQMAFSTFPKNFCTIWMQFSTFSAAIQYSGFSYGICMLSFGIGFVTTTTLLRKDFFTKSFAK